MGQPTFADLEYASKKRKTRREIFLERMDSLVPWDRLEGRMLMFSDSVLPNCQAKMSDHGDINVDAERTGKTSGAQQLTGRAYDYGPGGDSNWE